MTTLYLIRHAEAEGNLYRRVHGWYNSLVTDNGHQQILALERRFQPVSIDAVWSSDLARTMTTAQAIYLPKGLPLRTHPGLREVHMGTWEDKTWGQVRREDEDLLALFSASSPQWCAPEGECLEGVGRRVAQTVEELARSHPGQTLALFSHGMAIRHSVAHLLGIGPDRWPSLKHSDNTAVTRLVWDGAQFHLEEDGDATHLDPSTSTLARQSWWKQATGPVQDVNLWFRPLDLEGEAQRYLDARQEAWHTVHGTGPAFDGASFLAAARACAERDPWSVVCAMSGDCFAGVLQLDHQRYAQDGAGYIAFCYMAPELRTSGLGVQLIGQAVAHFRPLGRTALRLRCAPYNAPAQHFYQKYGFRKIGEEQGSRVPLDIMEKNIGYDR